LLSAKSRANHFAPVIGDLKRFLAQSNTPPTNGHLKFNGSICLPQFLDFLAHTDLRKRSADAVQLLLIASPLYEDPKEPSFSMVDGYFPSDGHLQASRESSVFGVSDEADRLPGLTLHWFYPGDPWLNELHKERIMRFWTLYLERRAAHLAAAGGDLPTLISNFYRGASVPELATRRWSVDPAQTRIEMLRVGRKVEIADWLTRDTVPHDVPVPRTMVGPMKIGIRWKERIDLDLYASPRPDAETLFFQHLRSPEGYYNKDHRSSPGKEYEFIEFESPVDIREVEAFVNFYKGRCEGGPLGEVRIEFDGHVYGAPFAITAPEGNLGQVGSRQQPFWTRVPVQEILKLSTPSARGG
jgi:hypothetical protein